MSRAVTFGEIMMRLNPEGYLRFVQAEKFDVSYAGGEANAAISLANYGIDTAFVSKIPPHEIGQSAVNFLRRYGVDTKKIIRGGERLGVYFLEKGASQRGSKVIYDRAGSAIAKAKRGEFNWDAVFEGTEWFHFTGITPALGGELPEICLDALKTAKKKGIKVSCDLNYRKKLWTTEEAGKVMAALMPYVDLCIANEEDAADVFGIHAENSDVQKGEINKDGYTSVAKQLKDRFGFSYVAITLRRSLSADDNAWAGLLYNGKEVYFSPEYMIHIVDRVGGGDSFGGALIYSLLSGYENQKAINFAVAASCLKHTIEQDFNLVNISEVEALAKGNSSGRVQR